MVALEVTARGVAPGSEVGGAGDVPDVRREVAWVEETFRGGDTSGLFWGEVSMLGVVVETVKGVEEEEEVFFSIAHAHERGEGRGEERKRGREQRWRDTVVILDHNPRLK